MVTSKFNLAAYNLKETKSHSLVAIQAVSVRDPLCLVYSKWKTEPISYCCNTNLKTYPLLLGCQMKFCSCWLVHRRFKPRAPPTTQPWHFSYGTQITNPNTTDPNCGKNKPKYHRPQLWQTICQCILHNEYKSVPHMALT